MVIQRLALPLLAASGCLSNPVFAQALVIQPPNQYAWGENVAFFNWADWGSPAESQMPKFFSRPGGGFWKGFIWNENVGWINLGAGDGPYANVDSSNFGVNASLSGQLSGYGWGENVGWINFSGGALAVPPQPARIDFGSLRLRGYAWGENIGWVNLDDPGIYVGLSAGCPCDLNHDGLVEDSDFVIFAAAYDLLDCADPAMPSGCPSDFNGDNLVEDADFVIFASAYDVLLCP